MEEYEGIIENTSNIYVRQSHTYLKNGIIHSNEVDDKHKELLKVLKIYTGDNVLKSGCFEPEDNPYKRSEDNNLTCICSKSGCGVLYLLHHIKSDKKFALGSDCITREFDIDYSSKVHCNAKYGRCVSCSCVLVGNNNGNLTKNYPFKRNKDVIKKCYECLKKDEVSKRLPKELEPYTISEKKYLNISYEKKDSLKKYGIKFDYDEKKWYYQGRTLPKGLEPYIINDKIYLNISYEIKEFAKERGAKWDAGEKKWYVYNTIPDELQQYA